VGYTDALGFWDNDGNTEGELLRLVVGCELGFADGAFLYDGNIVGNTDGSTLLLGICDGGNDGKWLGSAEG